MVYFTLYCFAKVFDLAYSSESTNSQHLINLFEDGYTVKALVQVVKGKTAGKTWVDRISMNEKLCKSIPYDIVRYVYRKIIKAPTNNSDTATLLEELLKYSIMQKLEIQSDIYNRKSSDEVREYIKSLRNMDECCFQSDEIFLTHTNNPIKEKNTSNSQFQSSKEYYKFIEEQINNNAVAELHLASHGGDVWLRPDSPQHRILKAACQKGIPVKIAINSPDAAEEIAKHMRDEDAYKSNFYPGWKKCIEKWKIFTSNYRRYYQSSTDLQFKLITIPILHNYVCCITKNQENSKMKVAFYTYNNPYGEKNFHIYPEYNSSEYDLFQKEFEYLWNWTSNDDE